MSFFKLTTTGSLDPVVADDLGGRFWSHPTVGENLLENGEFSFEELINSQSLADALDNGHITIELEGSGVINSSSGLNNVTSDHTISSHIDVDIDSITNGEILVWDSGKLVNQLPSEAGIATESYVNNAVVGLYSHQGSYDASTNTPDLDTSPSSVLKGYAYKVTVGGLFFTEEVGSGDLIIADIDNPSSIGDWTIIQDNIGDATTSVKGVVELAIDGENSAGVVVQGNDSRLSDARTPLAHSHDATQIVSGVFSNSRISQGNVTQHEGAITHNNLNGFIANEHIDHTSVSINTSDGVSGGGDISSTRTISLDIDSLTQQSTPDSNNDYIAYYDSSEGNHKKIAISDVFLSFIQGVGQVYHTEKILFQSTTSTSFVNYHTLNLLSISAGTYKIEWFYVWSHNATNTDFISRIQVDDVTSLIDPSGSGVHRQEPQDSGGGGNGGTDQRFVASGFRFVTLSPGNHFVDLDFRTDDSDDESTVHHCVLSATRIS